MWDQTHDAYAPIHLTQTVNCGPPLMVQHVGSNHPWPKPNVSFLLSPILGLVLRRIMLLQPATLAMYSSLQHPATTVLYLPHCSDTVVQRIPS